MAREEGRDGESHPLLVRLRWPFTLAHSPDPYVDTTTDDEV